jgi:hypothetical protein
MFMQHVSGFLPYVLTFSLMYNTFLNDYRSCNVLYKNGIYWDWFLNTVHLRLVRSHLLFSLHYVQIGSFSAINISNTSDQNKVNMMLYRIGFFLRFKDFNWMLYI